MNYPEGFKELIETKLHKVIDIIWDLELHGTWVKDKPRWRDMKKLKIHLERLLYDINRQQNGINQKTIS